MELARPRPANLCIPGAPRGGREGRKTISRHNEQNFPKRYENPQVQGVRQTPSAMHYVSDKSVQAAEEAPHSVQRPKDKVGPGACESGGLGAASLERKQWSAWNSSHKESVLQTQRQKKGFLRLKRAERIHPPHSRNVRDVLQAEGSNASWTSTSAGSSNCGNRAFQQNNKKCCAANAYNAHGGEEQEEQGRRAWGVPGAARLRGSRAAPVRSPRPGQLARMQVERNRRCPYKPQSNT